MYRTKCCVCEGGIQKVKTLENYPLSYVAKDSIDTRTEDCDVGICNECDTLQLMNLADPNIIYGDFHNNTSFSIKWQTHHDLFCKFIKDKLHGKSIEVGGRSGEIIKRLDDTENYYTLDFSNPDNDPKNLRGNCEDFDFTGFDCLIMSHVFEHLYNPKKFAQNITDRGVDDIFLSIPNMKTIGLFLPVHREHPYLCTESTVMRLFPKYSCTIEYFEDHSIFIHLFKTKICSQNVLDYYKNMENKKVENEYVFPSAMQGTHILYFTKCEHIKGFVDNDPLKQGKFLQGKPIFPCMNKSNVYMGHYLYNNDLVITKNK